ncbi:protein-binding activity modulator [Lithospermum erythrorhizon]|uniref:Protein-binding activity modulator n=1 Tax=Lithospermum erythrorhizon TaxID=34254 RepID=A0AAV3R3H9_LITER
MARVATAISTSPFNSHPLLPFTEHHVVHFPVFHYKTSACPKLSICYAKFSGSIREEVDDINGAFFEGDELMEDESDDEEDTESSIDLFLKFLGSMFKKVSRRARKASRSLLPDIIPPQLVSFSVDGVLLLASLSFLKALLEVVCNLGGTVFAAILSVRVIWLAISYFQSTSDGYNQSASSYGRSQPVS